MTIISSLETSIKNKLLEIPNMAFVYDTFQLTGSEGYPFASFELSDFNGEFLDTCTNIRNFTFNIVVLQKVDNVTDRKLSKDILYKCLDQIIEKFDGEQDLGNSQIVIGQVSSGDMGTFIEGEGQTLALSVKLTLTVNNSII